VKSAEGEAGYALVAAVASIAVFATIALAVLNVARMGLADAEAEQAQMRAVAAADAGITLGLAQLLDRGPTGAWAADGRVHALRFDTAELHVTIRDERGKVPLGLLDEAQATKLLEQAGLSGDALLVARDSLLDWIDDDEIKRPFGAEDSYYRAFGLRTAGSRFASIGELALVRGFDSALVARIRPYVTTYTLRSGFDAQFADPRALAVMDAGGEDGPAAIERARELKGQTTALALASAPSLVDRPLSIESSARLAGGGAATRTLVVELTDQPDRRYIVRGYE
jgi:general secretion pathway protein K